MSAPNIIAREIVDNLEGALEQFREQSNQASGFRVKPGMTNFLEVPMDKNPPALSTATFMQSAKPGFVAYRINLLAKFNQVG